MIRLIASDLDGTLLQNGAQSLTPDVISFIESLATKHNILFVAASGRQYPNLKRLFGSAAKHMAFICENGALAFYQDKLLYSQAMNRETALMIGQDILSLPGCEVLLSGQQSSYILPKDPGFYDHMANHIKNNVVCLSSLEEYPGDYYKVSAYEPSGIATGHGPELIKRYESKAMCTISGYAWIDFVAPGVNKGRALNELLHTLDINAAECAAFGDNYNDLEMLSTVNYGYVMDNAAEDIKKQFTYHCSDVVATIKELLN